MKMTRHRPKSAFFGKFGQKSLFDDGESQKISKKSVCVVCGRLALSGKAQPDAAAKKTPARRVRNAGHEVFCKNHNQNSKAALPVPNNAFQIKFNIFWQCGKKYFLKDVAWRYRFPKAKNKQTIFRILLGSFRNKPGLERGLSDISCFGETKGSGRAHLRDEVLRLAGPPSSSFSVGGAVASLSRWGAVFWRLPGPSSMRGTSASTCGKQDFDFGVQFEPILPSVVCEMHLQ